MAGEKRARSTRPQQDVRRGEERVNASVPVRMLGGATGMTRDLAPSGIYFVTEGEIELGTNIRFTLTFEQPPGRSLQMHCVAEVVRIEEGNGNRGVAVRILESDLVPRRA